MQSLLCVVTAPNALMQQRPGAPGLLVDRERRAQGALQIDERQQPADTTDVEHETD